MFTADFIERLIKSLSRQFDNEIACFDNDRVF
jgi:hypothetical protein